MATSALLVLGVLLSACGADTSDAAGGATTTVAPAAGGGAGPTAATISGFKFQPPEIHAKVGDTVTWTNNDGFAHTVKADGGSFDSGNIDAGKSFSQMFATAGTLTYFCNIHNYMKGSVVVA